MWCSVVWLRWKLCLLYLGRTFGRTQFGANMWRYEPSYLFLFFFFFFSLMSICPSLVGMWHCWVCVYNVRPILLVVQCPQSAPVQPWLVYFMCRIVFRYMVCHDIVVHSVSRGLGCPCTTISISYVCRYIYTQIYDWNCILEYSWHANSFSERVCLATRIWVFPKDPYPYLPSWRQFTSISCCISSPAMLEAIYCSGCQDRLGPESDWVESELYHLVF